MRDSILTFLFWVARGIFSLRYSLDIEGLEKIQGKKKLLFLPNHTALLDPLLLCIVLWPKFKIRPLVLELFTRLPFAGYCIGLVRSIPIPDFETSINQFKIVQAERALQKVVEALDQGDNVLMYPSGKLKRQGKEILGGNSGLHTILGRAPECSPVLVRISGFWGSSFSRSNHGKTPNLGNSFFGGMKALVKNLFFFTPRRKIKLQFEEEPADFPKKATRRTLNSYLEDWYNRYPDDEGNVHQEEPLKYVSFSMWKRELPQMPSNNEKIVEKEEGGLVSIETREKIYQEIRKILKDPEKKIAPQMNLMLDLGMDSLNIAELIVYLSRNFETPEIDPSELDTVESALKMASGKKKKLKHEPSQNLGLKKEEVRLDPALELGRNFPETFLKLCKRMKSLSAISDKTSGELTYKQMLRAVIVLAKVFQKFPEEKVAVMLPTSVGAIIAILALQLAGKIPVMLNWTLGPRYLEHMIQISETKRILSSWRFFERLSYVDFGGLVDKIVFLEDVKKSISLKEKLTGALLSLCPASWIERTFSLNTIEEEDTAVIFFTSGTETTPKGAILSHKNILSDAEGAYFYHASSYTRNDSFLSILPVFHSYGFSSLFYFFFLRMKIYFSPDPTDHGEVSRCIEEWKISMMNTVPLFFVRLLQTAKSNQLQSLKEVGIGGDKVMPELYQILEKSYPNIYLKQGYGVTECSPVVTMQRKYMPREGAGQFIHGIEAMTIDPETSKKLPLGSEGEICISGPIVFKGYLGGIEAPFLQIDGKQWYRTGDIGHVTANDSIVITARLKRFAKIGGEMISLGAIEDAIVQELKKQGKIVSDIPHLAICCYDSNGTTALTLFATVQIDKEQANEILRQSGFGRLIKIHEVRNIKEMPVMGSGKTNYRSLQAQIQPKSVSSI
ncbi:MAG: AMP-binding protein [Parachlamydiales bacterium]|nr:AMP-binding protein [Parachlamydiales bacterium]